jgi:hypothetical protein
MILSPKEKADELVLRYLRIDNNTKEWFNLHIAKQCALIAVDEIIKAISDASDDDSPYNHELLWWQEVKEEILNL